MIANNDITLSNSVIYNTLLDHRITKVLMICGNYDQFIMEEDGQIETRIFKEYIDLNISDPPRFIWASSARDAGRMMDEEGDINLVICMFNESDEDIFPFSKSLKTSHPDVPFVLLMHYSKEIRRKVTSQRGYGVDFIFSWHGNADLILAIIKLFEDRYNAPHDILEVGVQAILLVEDSIRYYSTYLPELYKLVLTQSHEFLTETLNEDQQLGRKRSRPKILLATCYEEAVQIYEKYKGNFLGVISDVGMVIHKGDDPKTEKLDAGIDLVNHIRSIEPQMPVLLQSSQASVAKVAESIGVGFLKKYSRTLFLGLSEFIRTEFGFGDFIFKDEDGEEVCRAANLRELEAKIDTVPDNILVYNTSKNMFSKWFYARGLFGLAKNFRAVHHTEAEGARDFLHQQLSAYRKEVGRGIIARFVPETYEDSIAFARLGDSSIGGKARGIAFLNKIIEKHNLTHAFSGISVAIPRTVVIATDFFDEFILENGLQYVIDSDLSDDEILSEFVASRLPNRLVDMLKAYLTTVKAPLAIRSSSKLEDSNYQPFAGVYSTYMVPACENRDQLLRLVDKAIKSVYASVYYNGSRSYISTTGNLQSEEKMAVVIQDICGDECNGCYFPLMSGVARSVNYYPIGSERPEDGVVNAAFGLGKSVVDGSKTLRFSPVWPKKILQLSSPKMALRDTQKHFLALDLRPGMFKVSRDEGVNLVELPVGWIRDNYAFKDDVASVYDAENDRMSPGTTHNGPVAITFDALLKYNKYPIAQALNVILGICREELMNDVEMEFAAVPRGRKLALRLLQVRPISRMHDNSSGNIEEVESRMEHVMVRSSKALGAGYIDDMQHIVMVDIEHFDNTTTKEIAAELAGINARLRSEGHEYMLIGPGRWGSSDPFLGIPVIWSDISEAKMIVECAIPGFKVEPSQGTHFFQNITSLGVGYLDIDTEKNPESLDIQMIDSNELVFSSKHVKVFRTSRPITAFIDMHTGRALAGIQVAEPAGQESDNS